ncbi:MAG: PAS domain-containing protein, partial [bacterium]
MIEPRLHPEPRDRPDLARRHHRVATQEDQEDTMLEHTHETPAPGHGPSPAPSAWRDTDALLQPFATVLVETAPDAIVLADSLGTIILWNKAAQTLFGYTEQEAIGQPLTSLMPERYRDAHQKGLAHVRATGHSKLAGKPVELCGLRKDGTEFPLELSLGTWQSGSRRYFSGIIRDITERKRAEETLRESQERFHQLAESIREVFWMTDPEKNQMIYISPGYQDIWGLTCESLYASPRSWLEAIHPDDRDRVLQAAVTKQATGAYDEEYRIVRPDGSLRWIWDRAFPIRDASGHVYRITGIAEDITERKEAEIQQCMLLAELAQAKEHFETIFKTTPVAIAISTVDEGRFVNVNDALARLTGYSQEELIGHTTLELNLWADPSERARVIQEIRQRGHLENKEGRLRTKTGEIRDLMTSVERIQIGPTACLIYITHDITDRNRAEAFQHAQLAVSQALAAYESLHEAAPYLLQAVCDSTGWELGV